MNEMLRSLAPLGNAWAFEAATALVNLVWLALSVWLVKRRAGSARAPGTAPPPWC